MSGGNGTSGNGDSGTGGAAGEGGAGEGGAPATGGTSGSGGVSGTGGTGGMAGQGGTAGDTTTGEGGEWSGPDDRSLDELCSEVCADQANVSCGFGSICEAQCVGVYLYALYGANEYRALLECEADNLTTENYENYCDKFDAFAGTLPFEAGTPCEDELCAWTCVPGNYYSNIDVRYDRCNACL
jgi:hypothetical protein